MKSKSLTQIASGRHIAWFSCGAPSAVMAKKALDFVPGTIVVNCDTRASENPDNYRFSRECQEWFGQPIVHIKSGKFSTVDEVFEKTKYMSGTKGARCTIELKKIPRLEFANPDDIHMFGFTVYERPRALELARRNPDLRLRFLLIELGLTKQDCFLALRKAGIRLPVMYELGFDNNNCPGCVKGSTPWYWDMIRKHFPEVFKRRCEQSRAIGCRLVEIRHHERIFLDELPAGPFRKPRKKENMSCGPECGIQQRLL